ncbi:hypothetical protein GCM10010211_32210 [Streptomyces albospinus]|uniref:Uncharacterized protein n=1 Tax=Streptomyces albospinus TaxID=285515 RepID=A0ABQ2V1Z4_9ACTN|nr:hypothetical protein [Streptomyces albospinus]GGU64696.1 hypothetical protein GCM10010211_32210 [Streptomyces albospinus]
MKMKKIIAAAGVVVAGAAVAISTQGIAQAATTPQVASLKTHVQTAVPASEAAAPRSPQADWTPPAGYTLERSFMGDAASCRKIGDQGVTAGNWHQYVCHEELVQVTDLPMLVQYLYVKK